MKKTTVKKSEKTRDVPPTPHQPDMPEKRIPDAPQMPPDKPLNVPPEHPVPDNAPPEIPLPRNTI